MFPSFHTFHPNDDYLQQYLDYKDYTAALAEEKSFCAHPGNAKEWDDVNTDASDHPDSKPCGPGYGF